MNRLHSRVCLTLTLGVCSSFAFSEEIVVIVNPTNSTVSMTVDQVEQIYLGKTNSLPMGGNASAVDLSEHSPLRDEFYQKAAARSRTQMKALWARLVFSGKNVPPKVLNSSADVKKFVASNSNGIGYIEKSAVDASVKIVLSIP